MLKFKPLKCSLKLDSDSLNFLDYRRPRESKSRAGLPGIGSQKELRGAGKARLYSPLRKKIFFKLIKPIDKLICLWYNISVPREEHNF